jgi:hypothetical protein
VGNTSKTAIRIGAQQFDGEALLEASELILRGEKRLRIPFSEMKSLAANDGALVFRFRSDTISIDLGKDAAKWLEKIRNPKSVIDKLGVKPGHKIAIVNFDDDAFANDLAARGATMAKKNVDLLFYGANTRADLARLAKLRGLLAQNGALWIIRPKGVTEITESETMAAGKAAGLVDVKVVRFSGTHTAEKFVIPLASRLRS